MRASLWYVANWLFFGLFAWFILHGLNGASMGSVVFVIGAFALSWAIGFVIIIAPGGIGPRELALVVLLGALASPSEALALAVITRLLMVLLDVLFAATVSVICRPAGKSNIKPLAKSQHSDRQSGRDRQTDAV